VLLNEIVQGPSGVWGAQLSKIKRVCLKLTKVRALDVEVSHIGSSV
jgi:hypothetical protein